MIKINKRGKLWRNATDEEKMTYCDGLYDSAKQHMTKRHYEWYMNRMFKEGHHYVQYNTTTNALERPPRAKGEVRVVVNKVRSTTRAIQNFATREEPKWVITPGDLDEDTVRNAVRVGKFMDYLYRKKIFEIIVDGSVESALDTSIAWVELVWDEKDANGQGDVKYILHDSFDIFTDPKGYFDEGRYMGRFLFKAISKAQDEIYNDERYIKKNRKKVVADEELAASEMKARIKRKESGGWGDALPSTTVKEFFLWDDEKNSKGGNLIRFTYGGGQVLREDELEDKEYTIYAMQLPLDPKTIYHRSWTADAIPLNKVLDRTLSQKVMYVNQALIYRIIAEKGHGANVGTIGNEQGEIIEVNKNRKFEQWQMAGLPAALDSLNGDVLQLIEDILGAHDACVSEDTEILTKKGWKKWNKIKEGDYTYTINPKTLNGEWNRINEIYSREKKDIELTKIKNNNISALVTNDHRWLVKTKKGNGKRKKYKEVHEFRETNELNSNSSIILSAECVDFGEKKYSDDFVELVGWVVCEGCYSLGPINKDKGKTRIRISQSKKPNPMQWNMIDALLKRMGIWTKPQLQKDGSTQFAFSGETAKKMRNLFPDKILTYEFILDLTGEQLSILFTTMMLADGCIEQGRYYSSNKQNIDIFQMVCSLLGYASRVFMEKGGVVKNPSSVFRGSGIVKDKYWVSVKGNTKYTGFNAKKRLSKFVSKEKYSGIIWCPKTKNTTWFMRKDGKTCFTGNTFGRIPTGARSGDMIEALQAGDANNLAGISKSLKVFLKVIGKATINKIAKKYTASRIAEITEPEQGEKYMKVIGEGASDSVKDKEKMTIVTSDSEVNVSIGSWLGYTRESQRETLLKMAEAGLVPAEEVLRQFQFPNIEELSEKARSERLEQHQLQAEIAGRTGGEGGAAPAGGADAQRMKALADKENTAMANGDALPPTEGADMNHTQAHMDFMQTQIYAELPPEFQQNIQAHAQGELEAQGVRR